MDAALALQLPGRANPIFLEGRLLPLKAEAAQAMNLHDGQVVQANLQTRGDQPWLILKGEPIPLPAGAGGLREGTVWLQVRQMGSQWSLQPMAAPPPAAPLAPFQGLSLMSRVHQLLFRPPGASDMLQLMRSGALTQALARTESGELQQLWQQLQLSTDRLQPEAIAQALAGAMGSEVWLARGRPALGVDPRQLLRKLLVALQAGDNADEDTDPDLIPKIRNALESLESHQVQAIQAQAQNEVLMHLVLPFVDAEPVELVFRRPPRQAGEKVPLTVNIHTQSEQLGEVWLRTQLRDLTQIELTMWAVREDVVAMARQNAGRLGAMLTEAGLDMKGLQIMAGRRPSQANDWTPSGRGMVVDLSA